MQKEYTQLPFSLPHRAYLIADALKESTKQLLILFGGLTFYILLGLYLFFFEHDPVGLVFFTILFYAFLGPFLIWYSIKIRGFNNKLEEWQEDYIDDMYSLIFNTTVPKGDTTGEKILSLASMILPQLREDYVSYSLRPLDHIKHHFKKKLHKRPSLTLNYKINQDYYLDLLFETSEGYFIVKEFKDKTVIVEDLRNLAKILSSKFKTKFLRRSNVFCVICVSKDYDKLFLNRESLEKIMTEEIKADFDINLVVEEDFGYSVLWVS
jgi:hypothetical protein